MLKQVWPAVAMIALMTILTGIAYPLGMTGVAQLLFPHQANGSLLKKDGSFTSDDTQAVDAFQRAAVGGQFAGQQAQQCRFAAAVRTEQPHLGAWRQCEREVAELRRKLLEGKRSRLWQ